MWESNPGRLLSMLVEGQPVLGIVEAPLLGERFIAQQGAGAYLKGNAIAITEVGVLKERSSD